MDRRDFMTVLGSVALAAGVTEAAAQTAAESMHPAKFAALTKAANDCVATGEGCLRHCIGMLLMKDTSMGACADASYQTVALCRALSSLAAVNSAQVPALAKVAMQVCLACQKECEKFPEHLECKECAASCKTCAEECRKIAA
jgi:Cys-rich four helix bundle protein (predicted Tat secretion target)